MINFTNRMVSLVKAPATSKNKLYVNIGIDGSSVFVPHGSAVLEEWHDGQAHEKITKIWATEKAVAQMNDHTNLWEVTDKILEDSRLIDGNDSYDHFLEFTNISTKEICYGATTVGSSSSEYWEVSKKRAMLQAD